MINDTFLKMAINEIKGKRPATEEFLWRVETWSPDFLNHVKMIPFVHTEEVSLKNHIETGSAQAVASRNHKGLPDNCAEYSVKPVPYNKTKEIITFSHQNYSIDASWFKNTVFLYKRD